MFFNSNYYVKGGDGVVQREITGAAGRFLGMWSVEQSLLSIMFLLKIL